MTDVIVPIGGFGRFGWGEMPWGQTDLPKAVTAIGAVTVIAEANIPVTGLRGYSVCWHPFLFKQQQT
jgi:hypothetical protein